MPLYTSITYSYWAFPEPDTNSRFPIDMQKISSLQCLLILNLTLLNDFLVRRQSLINVLHAPSPCSDTVRHAYCVVRKFRVSVTKNVRMPWSLLSLEKPSQNIYIPISNASVQRYGDVFFSVSEPINVQSLGRLVFHRIIILEKHRITDSCICLSMAEPNTGFLYCVILCYC